jgi:predicted esterase
MLQNPLRWSLGSLCLACLATQGLAQVERYELGLRLRAFERNLAHSPDGAPRRAALVALESAVQAFFRLDTRAVAAAIDHAEEALGGRTWSVEERAANTLQLSLAARLWAPQQGALAFTVSRAFELEAEWPAGLTMEVRMPSCTGVRATINLDELPASSSLGMDQASPGEHVLEWTVRKGTEVLLVRQQAVSVANDLAARLDKLRSAAERASGVEGPLRTIESTTLVALARAVQGMTRKRPEETVLPGTRLLAEAEALAALDEGEAYYSPARTGQFWLRIPLAKETASVRLLAPEVPADARRPLVIALHGAGGSENLFFDGYGDGLAARLAAERGWFLVAPRCSGFSGPDLPGLVAALAERWPIDTDRIAVVGHSMGAQLAIASTTKAPSRYRAVAALGGGGAASNSPGLDALPFFIGAGSRDFGRGGAKQLHERLVQLGANSTWHEFADIEHLSIVQFALPEVFAFFATAFAR